MWDFWEGEITWAFGDWVGGGEAGGGDEGGERGERG